MDSAKPFYAQNYCKNDLERESLLQRKRDLFALIRECRENGDNKVPTVSGNQSQILARDDTRQTFEQVYLQELDQITKMLELPEPSRHDPAERLPLDILIDIISISILEEKASIASFEPQASLDLLLPLALVSDQWFWAIIGFPRLWTHIDLNEYNYKPDARVKLFLALGLAKHAPLTLSVGVKNLTMEARDVVALISHRVKTIYLTPSARRYGSTTIKDDTICLLKTLMDISSYPLLDQVILGHSIWLPHSLLTQITATSPNLRYFKGLSCDNDSDLTALSPLLPLEYLEYVCRPSDSALFQNHILAVCKNVWVQGREGYECKWNGCMRSYPVLNRLNDHIDLQGHGPKRRFSEFRPTKYQCDWNRCKEAYSTINHLNDHILLQGHGPGRREGARFAPVGNEIFPLKTFRHTGQGTVAPSFLDRIREVSSLKITVAAEDFLRFGQALSRLGRLVDLALELQCVVDKDTIRGWDLSGNTAHLPNNNVRRLLFQASFDQKYLEPGLVSTFDRQVAFNMEHIVPAIQILILQPAYSERTVLEWVGGNRFPQLITLKYFLSPISTKMSQKSTLPSTIQSISVFPPPLTQSHLPPDPNIQTSDLASSPSDDVKLLASLASRLHLWKLVTAPRETYRWNTFHNSALQRLELYDRGDEGCTSFLVQLAREPELLPNLYSLTFGRAVEIDILFIALEERNIGAHSVSKITELNLFGGPSSRYLAPLRDLLAGSLSQRPTNYELSLLGNLEEYNDRNVPGCMRCHKTLRYCDAPVGVTAFNPPEYIVDPAVIYSLRSLDVINTWEERYQLWLRASIRREPYCLNGP